MFIETSDQIKNSTPAAWQAAHLDDLNQHFADQPLEALLQWSLATFGDRVGQVTSFGPTGMVVLDHLARLSPGIRIITIDTGFLFAETYDLIEQIQRRYPVHIDVQRPRLTPSVQKKIYHPELWYVNPDLCCHVRKVVPLKGVLRDLEAWLTGLRRDQSPTRAQLPLISWDGKYEMIKINPLAGWTRGQVWAYILEHNVPYNPLHDRGFASVGCTHCTKASATLADERSGRWQGFQKIECGIHI